jgi:hypothetical protein
MATGVLMAAGLCLHVTERHAHVHQHEPLRHVPAVNNLVLAVPTRDGLPAQLRIFRVE